MSEPLTPETRAAWRADAEAFPNDILPRRILTLLHALDMAESPPTPETRARWREEYGTTDDYWPREAIIRQLLDALDAAAATLARVEALADDWGHTRFRDDWDSYAEGRDDQIDRCEQQLRAVLDGREPSETTR